MRTTREGCNSCCKQLDIFKNRKFLESDGEGQEDFPENLL
jgi:hypothetical protein